MKALPEEVKIGPTIYTVKVNEELFGEQLYGQITRSLSLIELSHKLSPFMTEVTLWHEILHGILMQLGAEEQDEQMITALSHSIVGVIHDNPALVK